MSEEQENMTQAAISGESPEIAGMPEDDYGQGQRADSTQELEEAAATVVGGEVGGQNFEGVDNQPQSEEQGSGSEERSFNEEAPELTEEQLDMIADTTLEVIRELLFYYDAENIRIDEYEGDDQELIFDIIGDNMALLIGRHGHTLDSLQYLVGAMVGKRIGFHYPVVVDVEGYVNRRKQKLVSLAKSAAMRAIRNKQEVRLRPMNPYERRIIHVALKGDSRINTSSEGIEPNRQVVVSLK
ncbi:MAG: KH domain-containing protein [Actinomycetia bacterium]|nr:KH domain-containing protein [Actinomycetes bacterium]